MVGAPTSHANGLEGPSMMYRPPSRPPVCTEVADLAAPNVVPVIRAACMRQGVCILYVRPAYETTIVLVRFRMIASVSLKSMNKINF